jgi:heterodisulfide reductase subunit A2
VIEASCAAAQASSLLAQARGTLTRQAVYPPERDVSEEEAGRRVRLPLRDQHRRHRKRAGGGGLRQHLPGVAYAERNLYTCSQDTQEKIRAKVEEKGLNRVVVASCTPRTHEPLFQDTIRQAGLNPHLFELANIREQDSWVHRSSPKIATEKAKQLGEYGDRQSQAVEAHPAGHPPGGGQSPGDRRRSGGYDCRLSIASQGYPVYLVEKESELGGNLSHIQIGFNGSRPQELLRDLIAKVSEEPAHHC